VHKLIQDEDERKGFDEIWLMFQWLNAQNVVP
jgi:hypothetical protein